jgi:hypothetical protein
MKHVFKSRLQTTFIALFFFVAGFFISKNHQSFHSTHGTTTSKEKMMAGLIEDSETTGRSLLRARNPLIRKYANSIDLINDQFESTIRNCLGAKCFDMAVNGVDRVGFLAPPVSGVEQLLHTILKGGIQLSTPNLHFISTTNVPAYGYGKNHGWSRIIRIVRDPIPHAFNTLHNSHLISAPTLSSLIDLQVSLILFPLYILHKHSLPRTHYHSPLFCFPPFPNSTFHVFIRSDN